MCEVGGIDVEAGGALGYSVGVQAVEGLALGVVEHAAASSDTHATRASHLIGHTTRDLDRLLRQLRLHPGLSDGDDT